jgi:alpha-L-rhamnosidase
MIKSLVTVFVVFFVLSISAQSHNIRDRQWPSEWIAPPNTELSAYGVYFFRKQITLDILPEKLIIHVSADNRYKLYINGKEILKGPARSDSRHWYYESVDLRPYLQLGKNTLSALVWNQGEYKPVAQHSERTGFIVQSDTLTLTKNQPLPFSLFNTDKTWKVHKAEAYTPTSTDNSAKLWAYVVVGSGDAVNGRKELWGWNENSFDDSKWSNARPLESGMPVGCGSGASWHLLPSIIPQMEEVNQRFSSIRRTTCEISPDWIKGKTSLTIQPFTKCTILLDQSVLTVGYPIFITSGGKDAKIELEYAEALIDDNRQKGNRNDVEGRKILGYTDQFIADGSNNRMYTTLWVRTFRYLQITVETSDQALVINDFYSKSSTFPFMRKANISSSDTRLSQVMDVGWRTARLCAGETYFDCPYYEQLQYVGDTRIQALISMYMAGDDRLVRKAIDDLYNSMTPEGLTQSRYPSYVLQVIPPFSLFWVYMVHDYHMHRNDEAFVKKYLPAVKQVLYWYEQKIDAKKSMLGGMPWWNFGDWTEEWDYDAAYGIGGNPEGHRDGNSALITLQYAHALQKASEMMKYYGDTHHSLKYQNLAQKLVAGTKMQSYDTKRGMFSDSPKKIQYSQQTNIFAILTDAVPTLKEKQNLLQKVLTDTSLIQTTFYFKFYLTEAMVKAGMGDMYYSCLTPWYNMLDIGLTTFAEKPEPVRSDCHAWSASPNYHILSVICGVKPLTSGFKSVLIKPALGDLQFINATIPHDKGNIIVDLKRKGEGIIADLTLPNQLDGIFEWKGKKVILKPGKNEIRL